MSLAHRLGTQMQVDFAIGGETQIGRFFEDPAGDLQKTAQTDTTQETLPCRSLAPLFELIPLCEVQNPSECPWKIATIVELAIRRLIRHFRGSDQIALP